MVYIVLIGAVLMRNDSSMLRSQRLRGWYVHFAAGKDVEGLESRE